MSDRPESYNRNGETISREEYDVLKEKEKKDGESDRKRSMGKAGQA